MTTPAISAPTREVEGEVIWARPGVARPDVLWRHEAAFGLQRKQGGVKKHANQLASVSTEFIHDSPCGRVGGPQTGHVRGAGRLQLRTLSLQAAETREREPTWFCPLLLRLLCPKQVLGAFSAFRMAGYSLCCTVATGVGKIRRTGSGTWVGNLDYYPGACHSDAMPL